MQTSRNLLGGRPRIGVPVRLTSSSDPDPRVAKANGLFGYIVELLREGGAEPVPLTAAGMHDGGPAAKLASLDGVVLPGGGDLAPGLYGETQSDLCYDVSHAQDELDLAVARHAIDAGVPVLGICRGHQLLNVLYGGTLVQDMEPGMVAHLVPAPAHGSGPWAWHEVTVGAGSKVAALYGSGSGAVSVKIASGHHQAVARVAGGLQVTAVAEDGTVEALEDPERWVASVQWHPEALELPAGERLAPFRAFVEVCRTRP
ncbi:Putative glutamine amidotransferase Rv2859c [Arthrobacter sp. Bi26]|uniref:gamma-glutamyl-gamma-aminobutyrate hydrolase family protein n=1 Tax=Arthrobacter sp. Bi26 TaxID=2822350 RepID=UPI001D381A24|nr:type 1 glutamine amidotransferase [Arthrobacter sp. Bi26]CAH0290019.1 Putative glutamine amidotransferase Rv2859c [Arthrobacter sp. Bi26]